jgi:branched-chain amino acid transport system permease protein
MLVEQIINGVVLGSMYAPIAQGYTLIFGVLDKLNFAHGEILCSAVSFAWRALHSAHHYPSLS